MTRAALAVGAAAAAAAAAIASLALGGTHALLRSEDVASFLETTFLLTEPTAVRLAAVLGAVQICAVAAGVWLGTVGRWCAVIAILLAGLTVGLGVSLVLRGSGVGCPCGVGPEMGLGPALARNVALVGSAAMGACVFRQSPIDVPRAGRMLAVATVLLALLGAAWRCSGSGAGGPAAVEAEGRLLSGADGSRVGVCSFTNRSDEPQTISLAGTSCSCIRMNLTTDPWPLAPSETTTRVVWETKSSESPSSSATAFVSVSVRAGDLADTIRLRVW